MLYVSWGPIFYNPMHKLIPQSWSTSCRGEIILLLLLKSDLRCNKHLNKSTDDTRDHLFIVVVW